MIENLKKLGLTEYESKAFISLLKVHPTNGYNLSKTSGIPRSRIYEVVSGLINKGLVFETNLDGSRVFTPLEPRVLIEKLRTTYDDIIGQVYSEAEKLYSNKVEEYDSKLIKGYDNIISTIKSVILLAKRRISLSIWHEDLVYLEETLHQLENKGIHIRGIYFGDNKPFDSMVKHRRIERYVAEKLNRYLIIVIDDTDVFSGVISQSRISSVTWSKDPGEVDIKDDFIAHDVMINTYSRQLDDAYEYERALDLIRKDYFCYSDEDYETFKHT